MVPPWLVGVPMEPPRHHQPDFHPNTPALCCESDQEWGRGLVLTISIRKDTTSVKQLNHFSAWCWVMLSDVEWCWWLAVLLQLFSGQTWGDKVGLTVWAASPPDWSPNFGWIHLRRAADLRKSVIAPAMAGAAHGPTNPRWGAVLLHQNCFSARSLSRPFLLK